MKHACGLIRDILPLYLDDACSEESKDAVKEHLVECAECKAYYNELCASCLVERGAYDAESSGSIAESYKQARKKKRRKIIGFVALGILAVITANIILTFLLAGLLVVDGIVTKPDVYTDIADYNAYVCISEQEGYRYRLVNESIWPERITEDMNVVEFKLVHYDPWDPQYLGYMVVDYDEAAYEKEMRRLKFERQMDITGYYGSTGFAKYEAAAVYADETGDGMVYALTDGQGRIIYVLAEFCNFFFDLKYENFIPKEYLPEGFNAHKNNPYRDEWFKKVFG